MATAKKRTRPTKAIDSAELATILSFAELHGDKRAAAEFNVSPRTLQRHRVAIREGRAPHLAALVAQRKNQSLERCADLLTDTYEAALRRLKDVLPEAKVSEVISATQMLGELHIGRKALLGGDDEGRPPTYPEGPGSPEAEGPGRGGAEVTLN